MTRHNQQLIDETHDVKPKIGSSASSHDMSDLSALTLFSTYEQMALERIVGKKRCEHMLGSEKTTFMFK